MGEMKGLVLGFLEASKCAAIAASEWVGRGDKEAADGAAVEAMRCVLNGLPMDGRVVIGEGERDKAPMLYIGERLGCGGVGIDIAVDPLEGTRIVAEGQGGAMTVVAFGESGSLFHAPDVYMEKIVAAVPEEMLDLDRGVEENLEAIASYKGVSVSELVICVLKRQRHEGLLRKIEKSGAKVALISDGDIAGSLVTVIEDSGVDVYMGCGGAPEGVLVAAALKGGSGSFKGRLVFPEGKRRAEALQMGIEDPDKQVGISDMVKGKVCFIATGVTDGSLLKGVRRRGKTLLSHSMIWEGSVRREVRDEGRGEGCA